MSSSPTLSPTRIIKRHARHLYKANFIRLWLFSLLISLPSLLWEGVCLLFSDALPSPLPAAISLLLLLLTLPLTLGWMRVLYQLFMRDTSDRLPATAWGDLFYFYRRFSQTWKSLLLFEGVMGAASLISYLLSSLQKAVPLETSPSWLQAGFVFFSLLFLCAIVGILCRLLSAPYIFFHDEQTPPMTLLKKSISYTAGYFGFILGFVLSMCLLALIFPVLFGLLAASGIWTSSWGLWTANLLFSVLILPYILLAIAGLASVFMPTEKELAKQRKRG